MSERTPPSSPGEAVRRCPICRRQVAEDAPTFPFCGERCRTIDLAKWASGDYRITRPIEQGDLEEG